RDCRPDRAHLPARSWLYPLRARASEPLPPDVYDQAHTGDDGCLRGGIDRAGEERSQSQWVRAAGAVRAGGDRSGAAAAAPHRSPPGGATALGGCAWCGVDPHLSAGERKLVQVVRRGCAGTGDGELDSPRRTSRRRQTAMNLVALKMLVGDRLKYISLVA